MGPWERLKKHAGMEITTLDFVSVRIGRFHESKENGGRQYTAVGLGLDTYYVALNASWALDDDSPIQQLAYG